MIKALKTVSIIMVFVSILCCVMGVVFSKLAEANRGIKYYSGYSINGNAVVDYDNPAGILGGDSKKEQLCETMSTVFYVLSGIFVVSAIVSGINAKKKENAPVIKQYGTVIEKQNSSYPSLVVEFSDGSRKKLFIEGPLLITQGDKGIFGCKGNLIVEFNKDV